MKLKAEIYETTEPNEKVFIVRRDTQKLGEHVIAVTLEADVAEYLKELICTQSK